jgi:hypothetical protein
MSAAGLRVKGKEIPTGSVVGTEYIRSLLHFAMNWIWEEKMKHGVEIWEDFGKSSEDPIRSPAVWIRGAEFPSISNEWKCKIRQGSSNGAKISLLIQAT